MTPFVCKNGFVFRQEHFKFAVCENVVLFAQLDQLLIIMENGIWIF